MASFSLSSNQIALLAGCMNIGIEGADQQGTAEDIAVLAAFLDELESIPTGLSAEVIIMADHTPAAADDIADEITKIQATAAGTWHGRSSTLRNEQHLGIKR